MAEKIRVLYVDDESALLELGKLYLERSGDFTVTTATSAPEAIRILGQETFDTIVSDYQMPDMNGIEFLKYLKSEGNTTPFVIFTGKGREEVVIEALNAGADFYLQKGGEPKSQFAELSNKIRYAVSRKIADDSLKRSEEKYRHLIEHSNEAIMVAQDEMLRLVNHRTVEFTGYSEQELLSMQFLAFIHPDDRAMVMERYQKRMKGEGPPSRYAFRLISKDGGTLWVEISVVAIDWEGRPATLNFLTDITEHKQAEDALRESEARYREFFSISRDSVFITSPEGRWIDFNDATLEIFGYESRTVLFEVPLSSIYAHPEERAEFLRLIEQNGYVKEYPVQLKQKDGTVIETLITAAPVRNPDGPVKAFIGTIRDVTDRKHAEETLQESEKKYRTLVETLNEGIWVIDKESVTTYVNPKMAEILGYTINEMIGRSLFSFMDDEGRRICEHLIERRKQGIKEQHVFEFLKKDGTRIYTSLKTSSIKGKDGEYLGAIAGVMDITGRKRAEEALYESEERFRELFNTVTSGVAIYEVHGDGTTGKDYIIRDFNKIALEREGKTKDEVIGKSLHDLRPTIDEYGLIPVFQRVWKTGVPELFPEKIYVDEKYTSWYENRVFRLQSGEVVSVYNDITDSKRAEEEIARLASFPQLNPAMVFEIDPAEQVLFVNPAMQSTMNRLGLSSPLSFIPEDVHQLIREWDTRTRANYDRECSVADRQFLVSIYLSPEYRSIRFYLFDITGRKRAEEALRDSEEKYHTVADFTFDWEFWIAPDRKFIYVSPSCERITGYRPEEFMLDPNLLITISHKDDRDRLIDHLSHKESNIGEKGALEFRIISRSGEERWIAHECQPVYGRNGEYRGNRGSNRDITERKASEESLRQSEARFRALAENSSDIIRILDHDGRIVFDTSASERLLGYPKGFSIGRSPDEFIHPDDLAMVKKKLSEVYAKTNPVEPTEFRIRRADGPYTWVESLGKNLIDVPGVDGVVITTRFIDDRKKAEEALVESEERYRALVDHALDAILIFDFSGTVLFANHATATLVEVGDPHTLTGRNALEFIAPESRDTVLADFASVMEGRDAYLAQYKVVTATGREKWVESIGKKIQFGGVPADIVMLRDITERKQAQEALRKAHDELESRVQQRTVELSRALETLRIERQRFYDVLETLPVYICLLTPDYHMPFANKYFRETFGESKGRRCYEFLFNRTKPCEICETYTVIKTRAPHHWYWTGPNGRDYDIYDYPFIETDGSLNILEMGIDITDSKRRSEEALWESEGKYRTLVETTGTGFVIIDDQGRVLDANLEYAHMTGHTSLEEIVGRNVIEWTAAYEKDKNAAAVNQCMRDGYIRNLEIDYVNAPGTIIPIEINATVLRSGDAVQILTLCRDITERKQAEKALRESERELKVLFKSMINAFVLFESVFDDDGNVVSFRFVFINDAYERITGVKNDEVLGKTMHEVWPGTEASWIKAYGDVAVTGVPSSFDMYHEPTKKLYYCNVYRPGDSQDRICVIFEDITERKRAEEALSNGEKKYRELIELLPQTVFEIDHTGRVTSVNPIGLKSFGYSNEDLEKGLSAFQVFAPKDHQRLAENIQRILKGEPSDAIEYIAQRKDGSTFPVITYSVPIIHEHTLVGLRGVLVDITERKQAEEALVESESFNRGLVENLPDYIAIYGVDGKLLYVNPASATLLGYSAEKLVGTPVLSYVAEEYRDEIVSNITDRREGGEIKPYEIDLLTQGGLRRSAIVKGTQIQYRDTPATLLVLTDITDRKLVEEALRQVNKQLNLLSSITRHDILNQLMALKGYIELSRDYLDDKKTLGDFLEKEEKAARTIEDQITFTKNYQELGIAAPEWQNVNASIEKAIAGLPTRDIHVDVDPKAPEIFADPLFEKVFYNLIDNALRYGGADMKTIRVSSQESNANLTILCEDDGVGISDEDKKHLFTRGFGKNTGLGLFLSREILAITGITITENGEPGKGARFEITVPKGMWRMSGANHS